MTNVHTDTTISTKALPPVAMPAHHAKRFYRRYTGTLLAVSAPALVAGLVAGWMFNDVKPQAQPTTDLVQRIDTIRMVEEKLATLEEDAALVRTSALHLPVTNVSDAVR